MGSGEVVPCEEGRDEKLKNGNESAEALSANENDEKGRSNRDEDDLPDLEESTRIHPNPIASSSSLHASASFCSLPQESTPKDLSTSTPTSTPSSTKARSTPARILIPTR